MISAGLLQIRDPGLGSLICVYFNSGQFRNKNWFHSYFKNISFYTYSIPFLILLILIIQSRYLTAFAQSNSPVGYGVTAWSTFDVNSCGTGCTQVPLFNNFSTNGSQVSFAPDGTYYTGMGGDPNIRVIDLTNGSSTVIYTCLHPTALQGLVAVSSTLFYTLDGINVGTSLYRIEVNSNTITNLGATGFPSTCDLTLYNGGFYYISENPVGLVQLDTTNPDNSTLLFSLPLPSWAYSGLTASPFCNTLFGVERTGAFDNDFLLINLLDGSVTKICSDEYFVLWFSSMLEHANPAPCDVMLDLDCDDSNSIRNYDCLDVNGEHITDTDIGLFADALLEEMTVTIAPPIPDAPLEILDMTGTVPNIGVWGASSSSLTLTNGGGATFQDFKDALQLVVYKNLSTNPTSGIRTIEVQFTTESGTMSNIAEYYMDVDDLGHLTVDLGPDMEICDGTSLTLDAANPGALYEWSTGESSQTISVDASGEFMVTVSDGVLCPGIDTVVIDVIPNIAVSLTGDNDICDNEQATLTIQTDSPFPINVTIDADPGSPFVFTGIDGTYSFTDLPFVTTEYTITEVVPDQAGCIELTDPSQVIEVYPTYVQEQEVSLCDGDSIWLGYYWESEAGAYENLMETVYGCDSMVTTYLTILPAVMIQVQSFTCDSAGAGVFITHLDNPSGCDTVVTSTVTLLPSDTTNVELSTCVSTHAGIVTDTFINQNGCDSLVITTTSYMPPSDTTFVYQSSCDSSALGVSDSILTGYDGCDSLVVVTVSFSLTDTTYISGTSCIPSEIGVFETLLSDAQGCDSLVISTITQGLTDTTLLFTTSCDPASLGVFEELLTSSQGCDSLVITTVTFSAQDSTFISSSTCDPAATGVFVAAYINQFGCDSIVTETVSLLPSSTTAFQSTTCDPSAAGVFNQMLTNQYGCDSIVTETVTLLPSDATSLAATTCIASEAGVFVTTLVNQYGCDSVITETITLLPIDTTTIQLFTCDPAETGVSQHASTGSDGCDSLVIETTILYPLPNLIVQSGSDYNGYDISCEGRSDGSAMANVSGVPPYTYLWSTNHTDQLVTGLSSGSYAVSITDGNGCMTDGVITLTEPPAFRIGFEVSEPDCFGQQVGSITVKPNGGVGPYTYSIDGTVFQASPDFTGLSEGVYQITSLDANDCNATEIISIDIPLMVHVELGDDQVISLGDSANLQAVINLPFDSLSSIVWTGIDSIDCPNCLTQIVAPIITTAYTVSVTSTDGCADRDSLTVFVATDHAIYIPNIFSPNGDGINDQLTISMGQGVKEITAFTIFDRWGNMVFQAEHILPTGTAVSWDGKLKGELLNPAVFTYMMIAEFEDGQREVRYGDVTLIR